MKNLFKILFIAIVFFSCEKNETTVLETHDFKATQIEQIGALFEGIGRQPELADELIAIAKKGLFKSYEDLLPISDKAVELRGKARGYAIGKFIDAALRLPERFSKLETAAIQLLGVYNKEYISDELNEYAIANSHQFIFQAIARQPETKSLINKITEKFLGISIL